MRDLQQAAVDAFEGRSGAAVAIDPRNGEVLAMVSLPGFDPNLFVNGISRADYAALRRARPAAVQPRAAGRLRAGLDDQALHRAGRTGARRAHRDRHHGLDRRVPPARPGAQSWRDWKRGGHGRVDLHEALAQSVNTYFYQLAYDIGIDRLGQYLAQFGFGEPTGIDLRGEARGVLPSREWKQRASASPGTRARP